MEVNCFRVPRHPTMTSGCPYGFVGKHLATRQELFPRIPFRVRYAGLLVENT